MKYGIGRLSRDIDRERETIAGLEAPALVKVAGYAGFAPAGTTEGERADGRCGVCGKPHCHWTPGAGEFLCCRHWDEY